MTESRWKLVMDRQGRTTIAADKFELTTTTSEPLQMEAIVSELMAMTRRTYGQYCGLSRAMEMVGERWGMLIVRDLLVSPKSVAELHQGLPLIPTELLASRLKEMERSGVVRIQDNAEEGAEARYELTEYGQALEEVVLAFGRWGAATLHQPRPEDVVTPDSLTMALRATFQSEAAKGLRVSYELHFGDIVLNAKIDDGRLTVGRGPLPGADAVLEPGPLLKGLMTGEVTPAEALASGTTKLTGDPELLSVFAMLFRLPQLPAPAPVPA
ncbi:MAG TPA: helix-turn-helix domain-containing protein [Actinophytocola sp.]|uniref:helix-turn-helix domain-containing protein n=1 Tax=Actinophytocola sp. TaxID=1872138 RepID=UPI002DDD7755|nr:helix-turn-helix domain-containing protein [Actinophytocola sp.]HEV2778611.1 helix-turn-helix domain-containing protein [Actinophytocola sp.]